MATLTQVWENKVYHKKPVLAARACQAMCMCTSHITTWGVYRIVGWEVQEQSRKISLHFEFPRCSRFHFRNEDRQFFRDTSEGTYLDLQFWRHVVGCSGGMLWGYNMPPLQIQVAGDGAFLEFMRWYDQSLGCSWQVIQRAAAVGRRCFDMPVA